LHRYGDIAPQREWGHEFDLLGLRGVINHERKPEEGKEKEEGGAREGKGKVVGEKKGKGEGEKERKLKVRGM